MPTQEQLRKERFEEILAFFEDRNVKSIDPILYKIRTLYPWLTDATIKDYAATVMRMLEVKRLKDKKKEIDNDKPAPV